MTSALAYMHGLDQSSSVRSRRHSSYKRLSYKRDEDETLRFGCRSLGRQLSKSAGPLTPRYLPSERLPPTSAHSSLRGDVCTLGVSLIEIFTGLAPVQEERSRQLSRLMSRALLHEMCSNMIAGLPRVEDSPASVECFFGK